jgi:hypothetical protein
MKVTNFTRRLVPAFGLACALGLAQAANAQNAPSGTMAPMPGMTQTPTETAPSTTAPSTMAPTEKTTKLSKSSEFKTEAEAAEHCPNDTVVWAGTGKNKSFHTSDSKYYGKTKHGAYVCKADAVAAGYHQSTK